MYRVVTPAQIIAHLADVDRRLVAAVVGALGTTDVVLVEHRPTGVGDQTVPVFRVPPTVAARARALGLTIFTSRIPEDSNK